MCGEKAYYKTTAPDASSQVFKILTLSGAREDAEKAINAGKAKRYYIVKIIEVIEPDTVPIKITPYPYRASE